MIRNGNVSLVRSLSKEELIMAFKNIYIKRSRLTLNQRKLVMERLKSEIHRGIINISELEEKPLVVSELQN